MGLFDTDDERKRRREEEDRIRRLDEEKKQRALEFQWKKEKLKRDRKRKQVKLDVKNARQMALNEIYDSMLAETEAGGAPPGQKNEGPAQPSGLVRGFGFSSMSAGRPQQGSGTRGPTRWAPPGFGFGKQEITKKAPATTEGGSNLTSKDGGSNPDPVGLVNKFMRF